MIIPGKKSRMAVSVSELCRSELNRTENSVDKIFLRSKRLVIIIIMESIHVALFHIFVLKAL